MARGGARSGRPGAQYSNRSDLQQTPHLAPAANVGQPYGTATQQLQSQQNVPMGPPPAPPPIPLSAPTSRPGEPVQSGLPIGPGSGPPITQPTTLDPVEITLRGLYAAYPNSDLASLLEMIDNHQTF